MSQKFAIMCDITSDITLDFQKKYDIEVLYGHYTTPDGKEHPSVLDWKSVDRDQFYKDLKKNPNAYKTSPANVMETFLAYEKHIKLGEGVIAISISQSLSGTYAFMKQAKDQILEKYPDADIEVIDSMRFGPAVGLLAVYASNLRKEGKSFKEVVKWVEENKNHFHQTGWMDDLSFVAKKGRITHAKAFFGSLVGIKPVGEFDYNGMTTVIGKCKGEKEAYKVLIEYIKRHAINPEDNIFFIATSNRQAQAEVYKNLIKENINPKEIYVNDVYPNCGINIGPGLMAAYYYGKPISHDLKEETEVFNQIKETIKE
ncbi:MAG: DegV family protein [Bacilli bacterium]|nr:DegV family protein [Bacilli bacterium]